MQKNTTQEERPYLSVVIPAYNEAKRLPKTLLDVDKHLSAAPFSYEIVVVNDGSKDNTAEVTEKFKSTVKNLRLIDFAKNRGKGAVVRDGMLMARGEYRLFMDADNSTSVDHFEKMIPYFKDGFGVVICSRAHRESVLDPAEPWYRQIPGKIGNLIIQILVLPGYWDTQCGFKAFTAEAADRVFNIMKIDRWGFDIEALALSRKMRFKIKEVPVHWINDTASHVSASAYLKTLIETLKIRLWLWTGKYDLSQKNEK
ncbi:MAG: dolichyl-phosphate beta-glucosyltransferase [Patescibacteria group bacterium]